MKKFIYLALSILLSVASCSNDDSDNDKIKPGQLINVCIGVKLDNEDRWIPNIMKVPYHPIPYEEWPAPLKEMKEKKYFSITASICRIETDKGIFYHTHSMVDSNVGGYFFTSDGLQLSYTDAEWKTQLRAEVPEGFPCLDGWECIYYYYPLGHEDPLWEN